MRRRGFTLIELLFVVAIIGVLAALSLPSYRHYREQANKASAITTMKSIADQIKAYGITAGVLPSDLTALGLAGERDPWGNPYQYTNLSTALPGQARKDRFLVPINSDFDLYSMGPDGTSVPALTANCSRDDVVRANDGTFYGWARDY